MSDDMKDEYDFSRAERGRFFRQDAASFCRCISIRPCPGLFDARARREACP